VGKIDLKKPAIAPVVEDKKEEPKPAVPGKSVAKKHLCKIKPSVNKI
jgi:hypothetical protein